jgi:transcriptional regulator NrdR family protein
VRDTREHFILALAFSTYRRRRTCLKCEHRFTTVEIAESDIEKLVKAERERITDQFMRSVR